MFIAAFLATLLCLLVLFHATSGCFLCWNSEVRNLYHYTFNTYISHTFDMAIFFCYQENEELESCINYKINIK